MNKDIRIYLLIFCCLLLNGCDSTEGTLGGAALGTAAGAGLGYAIDGGAGGAVLGGVLGGLGGAAFGHHVGSESDKKEAKIARQQEELRLARERSYNDGFGYDRSRYDAEERRRRDEETIKLRQDIERKRLEIEKAKLEKELHDHYR
ncbi:MAG: hypothetical protein LBI37_03295 [Puniceicoccales bacterium]|jgi:uncharacterized protein YcfJ|nr:hypothetical protein [Puniceicoccales bacterium]